MALLSMAHGIMVGLAWEFLMLLAVGADFLQYFVPPGTTRFNIHEYCISLICFFNITNFALVMHVLEKFGRKFFILNMQVWP